jgi:hypothetical protein
MNDFLLYFQLGLHHVLDINAYDHVLFFIALMIPYGFRDIKNILILVTIFTIGHTSSLILSVFNIVSINPTLVEFLIPLSILLTALYYMYIVRHNIKHPNENIIRSITMAFGIIHGLGFSNYFKAILPGNASDKLLPLLEFALGIETAQIVVVILVLVIGVFAHKILKFSTRDWALTLAVFVIGVVTPMLIESDIWILE